MTAVIGAPACGQFDHRAVERAAEVHLAGRGGLDVLWSADGVAYPFERDIAEVAEVRRQFGRSDLACPALITDRPGVPACGTATGERSRYGREPERGKSEESSSVDGRH